jgi:hypothetical protein
MVHPILKSRRKGNLGHTSILAPSFIWRSVALLSVVMLNVVASFTDYDGVSNFDGKVEVVGGVVDRHIDGISHLRSVSLNCLPSSLVYWQAPRHSAQRHSA